MDVLIHFISTTRFKNVTGPTISKHIAICFSCLVLSVAIFCASATAATPLCKQPPSPSQISQQSPASPTVAQSNQLHRVWQENQAELWFYDDDGQPVVPTIDNNWLAVRFTAVFTTGSDMPEVMRKFNQRYADALIDVIYNPAQPDLGLYRFKPTHRNGVINAILAGGNSTIRYILPALITHGKIQILGEQISVRWKSQIRPQRRQQLLQSVGAIDYSADLTGREEVIQIDPCQMSAWKAANRLAEDVQVVSATPELLAVEAPISVRFSLTSPGAVAGAAIPFSLDIHFNDDVRIELGTLANLNLKPTQVFRNLFAIEYDTPLSAVDIRRSPIQLRGRLYLYASGEFELPSIPVFYRNDSSDASKVHRITTPTISVRMAALVPEAEGDYRLQVPAQLDRLIASENDSQPPRSPLWRALIAMVLFVSGLGVILRRQWQHRQQQPQTLVVETTALQQLQQALEPPQSLARVGQTLRYYLIDWAGAEGLTTGGGSRLFFNNLQPYINPEYRLQIEQVLQHLDNSLASTVCEVETNELLEQVAQLTLTLEKHRSSESLNSHSTMLNP